jgi:hypothetical protein
MDLVNGKKHPGSSSVNAAELSNRVMRTQTDEDESQMPRSLSTQVSANMNASETPVLQQFVAIDPGRRTFADYPGEVRNTIYKYALTPHHPLHKVAFIYNHSRDKFSAASPAYASTIQALKTLSGINRGIRQEARSFFFSNNTLSIEYRPYEFDEPSYLGIFADLLEILGQDGRERIMRLDFYCQTSLYSTTQHSSTKQQRFSRLLAQCKVLKVIDMEMSMDDLRIDMEMSLDDLRIGGASGAEKHWYHELYGMLVNSWLPFIELFSNIPSLGTLEVYVHDAGNIPDYEEAEAMLNDMARERYPALSQQRGEIFTLYP